MTWDDREAEIRARVLLGAPVPAQDAGDLLTELARLRNSAARTERALLEAEALRDGAVRACSQLRREVRGVNRALRDSQARNRLLERTDRDPRGVETQERMDAMRADSLRRLNVEEDLRATILSLHREIRDLSARARGVPDHLASEILRLLEQALDHEDPVRVVELLGVALEVMRARRDGTPWPPPGDDR